MTRLRSVSPRAWAIVATIVALAIAAAAFLIVMAQSDYRRTATNSLVPPTHAEVPQGQSVCQDGETVPKGSRFAAPWAGGARGVDGGPVSLTIKRGDRVLARGRSPDRFPTGVETRFPLDRTIDRELRGVTVCFTNHDPTTLFAYGDWVAPEAAARAPVTFGNAPMRVRLDWYGAERQSWWSYLGSIAHRFPLVKAPFLGTWSFWLAMVALLALSAAAIWRTLREARP